MGAETRWVHTPPRYSATFDEHSIAEIHRAAATGIYDIRGVRSKAQSFPISTICCSSAPRSAAIRSKAIGRSARPT